MAIEVFTPVIVSGVTRANRWMWATRQPTHYRSDLWSGSGGRLGRRTAPEPRFRRPTVRQRRWLQDRRSREPVDRPASTAWFDV